MPPKRSTPYTSSGETPAGVVGFGRQDQVEGVELFKVTLMAMGIKEDKATVYAQNLEDQGYDLDMFLIEPVEELAEDFGFVEDDIKLVIRSRLPAGPYGSLPPGEPLPPFCMGEKVYYYSKTQGKRWIDADVTGLNQDGTVNLNVRTGADPTMILRTMTGPKFCKEETAQGGGFRRKKIKSRKTKKRNSKRTKKKKSRRTKRTKRTKKRNSKRR
jgi:hypothetical protein